jgi:YegS/Rv2252/BmrU family lipid kinase
MTMHDWYIILNPWAGRGQAGKQRHHLEQTLQRTGIAYHLAMTHAPGGATELTWQALERGHTRIAAVGGDGTINEVVNGIMLMTGSAAESSNVSLGIVPLGTASDFIKSLDGFTRNDIASAVQRLATGQMHRIDVGCVTVSGVVQQRTRYFANGLGMGIDARVGAESIKLKRLKGFAAYLVAAVRALATYRAHPMTVRAGTTHIHRRLLLASVANGRCQGGGFWLTPDARLDDGMLDLCLIDSLRLDQIIRHFAKLFNGTHTHLPFVTMGRAARVEAESRVPVLVAADGEIVTTDAQQIAIETRAQALTLVV